MKDDEVAAANDRAAAQLRRASRGRALVGLAVFAPAVLILGLFLLSRGSIYNHRFTGPKWPWIVADVALLLLGIRMMRGEDL